MPGGKSMPFFSGKYFSLPFLPETTLSPSHTLDPPHALLPELLRYNDTTRCAVLGPDAQGHRQEQVT